MLKLEKERWEKMTREQRKVAVAEDVLIQLHAKKLKHDSFIRGGDQGYGPFNNLSKLSPAKMQKKAQETLEKGCTPCGIGSLFIAKIARFNHAKKFDLYSRSAIVENLADCFDERELLIIESLYEGTRFLDFHRKSEKLRVLMQSIIDNDGEVCYVMDNYEIVEVEE
jgi:hypothetical protein